MLNGRTFSCLLLNGRTLTCLCYEQFTSPDWAGLVQSTWDLKHFGDNIFSILEYLSVTDILGMGPESKHNVHLFHIHFKLYTEPEDNFIKYFK